ncbi:MAG: chromate efflux transporter [Pirellulales bacterium]
MNTSGGEARGGNNRTGELPAPDLATPPRVVSLREAFWTWSRVAMLSFGGPAGQIAVMHRIVVDEKKWIGEQRYLHALNYCMLLPGPEATQLAVYIGWLMHRTLGGLMAGILFVLPGFAAILALSIMYARYQETHFVQAIFFGLKPAVMAIVLEAVLRIGKRVLKNGTMLTLAASSFVAIFFFNVPFPLLILSAALIGFFGGRIAPQRFVTTMSTSTSAAPDEAVRADVSPSWRRSAIVCAVCLSLWFGPIIAVGLLLGPQSVLFKESVFFSQAAVVTFGGAYSVLAYITQQAVEKYGWLQPGEMLDGLGMAETTPGPLIMVVQFVAFMGAYRNPGPFDPLTAGILGSVLTTWVTFVPCFFWIFLGAPYIERLRGNRLLGSALSAITAAVVGVILNLAVWFSIHTLFAEVRTEVIGPVRLLVPEWDTMHVGSLGVAVLAVLLTFYWKRGMAITLATSAALGLVIYYATNLS